MSTIRRKDSRGYALYRGESQRKDKRYCYAYTDKDRKRHYVYANDLQTLRQKEQKIRRKLEDGLDPDRAERNTINKAFDQYMETKAFLRDTTRSLYLYDYDHFVRYGFGNRKIADVHFSDIKKFYLSLLTDKKVSISTVESINTLLHPAFEMAVRDGFISGNPASGVLTEIKKDKKYRKRKRRALTTPEQKAFMNYLCDNKEFYGWKPIITVLLGTGMRIGECLGLRWSDLDFEARIIHVNISLIHRKTKKDGETLHIHEPKTEDGVRTIPMIDEVYEAFLEEYEIQKITGFCQKEIDGFSGFVFGNSAGSVTLPSEVNRAIDSIVQKYNEEEAVKAKEENRAPLHIREFSAHVLRHTFCTRLCEVETNIKFIQSVMGHKDIRTTLEIYAECTDSKKQEEILHLNGKIIIR